MKFTTMASLRAERNYETIQTCRTLLMSNSSAGENQGALRPLYASQVEITDRSTR